MVSKEAGRPLPTFSEDDVLDFQVTEAVILKGMEAQREAQEEAQKVAEREAAKQKARDELKKQVG